MKNKLYFYSAFALALTLTQTLSLHSQPHKYIPFPDSNYIWVVEYYDEYGDLAYGYQRVYNGQVEINNQQYNLLQHITDSNLTPQPFGWYGIRNDTATKKVYIYDWQSGKEKLLYDFSLKIGDTIPKDFNSRYIGSIITDIDSINIAGSTHLVYFVDNNTDRFPYIEGIGSIGGPIEKNYSFEGRFRLRCTMIKSTLSSYYTIPGVPCKLFHYTDVTELMPFIEVIEIFPNPVDNSTIKLLSQNDSMDKIEFYTVTGKLIHVIHHAQHEYLLSNDFFENKGIFIVKVTTSSGKIYVKKIIKL